MVDLKSKEWKQGDTSQQRWAEILTAKGNRVLPAYAFEDVVKETKVPMMMKPGGLIVTPDILCLSRKGITWHEVKSKSIPSWRRCPPGPRWEHGIDFDLIEEYQEVEEITGSEVYIIVHELKSPADPLNESDLILSGKWLVVKLKNVVHYGDRRLDWPKRYGNSSDLGRNGKGGWLWDRSIMRDYK